MSNAPTPVPTTAPPKICVRCDGPLTESVMRGEYFCTTNGKCPLFYKEQLGKDASPALKTPELGELLAVLAKAFELCKLAPTEENKVKRNTAIAAIEAYVSRLERGLDSAKRRIVADNDERIRLVALGSRLEGERDAAAQSRNDWRQLASDRRDVIDTLEARVSALTEAARTADVSLAVVWRRDILVGLDAASVNEVNRQKHVEGARALLKLFASHAALTEALQKISGLNPREDDTELTAIVRAALSPTGGANDGG